jgi:hypothetical protein
MQISSKENDLPIDLHNSELNLTGVESIGAENRYAV